jgi:hypothetical protein
MGLPDSNLTRNFRGSSASVMGQRYFVATVREFTCLITRPLASGQMNRRIITCLALRLILVRIQWLGWLPLVPSVSPIETPQSMRSCESYYSLAEDAELNDQLK